MKTLTYKKVEYKFPFSERFRRHTKEELEMISESLEEHGFKHPVLIYTDEEHGKNCVLDGEGRLTCAINNEKIKKVPFKNIGKMSFDDAYEEAKAYNDHRRQDDPESIAKRKAERVKRVAEARAEGQSTRAIAANENVSQTQIVLDLATSTEQGCSVEPQNVRGIDGKNRKATTKIKCDRCERLKIDNKDCEKCKEARAAKKEEGGKPKDSAEKKKEKIAVDNWGIPIQPHAAEAFAAVPRFEGLVKGIRAVQKAMSELAEEEVGAFLQKRLQWKRSPTKDDPQAGRWIFKGLGDAIWLIQDCTPTQTICPYMYLEDNRKHPDNCTACLMANWTPKLSSVPENLIKRAKEAFGVQS